MKCTTSIFLILMLMVALVGVTAGWTGDVQAACQEYVDQNSYHVAEGRAYTKDTTQGCNRVTTYYAVGSNNNLGTSAGAMTTLYSENGRTYHEGKCPSDLTDYDRDGYTNDVDCNDLNRSIHPDAEEICDDGIDQDCNHWDLVCMDGPCRSWTATNDEHQSAGRASTYGGCNGDYFHPTGSDDNMGAEGELVTTLHTLDSGQTYHLGECPAEGTENDEEE